MRISINLTAPTIEQVISKRRKICTDMGRGLLMEMRTALNKRGSNETDEYLKLMEGMMAERPLSHEATWYNDDPSFQEAVNESLRLKREVRLSTRSGTSSRTAPLPHYLPNATPCTLFLPRAV